MFQIKLGLLAVLAVLLTPHSTFAKQTGQIEPRIIFGRNAIRGQFPYYVYLENVSSSKLCLGRFEYRTFCGASLISSQWILTAGHCVSPKDKKIRLHFGSLIKDDENEIGREIIEVSGQNVHVHPNHTVFLGIMNSKQDIALIKLPSPVQFTDYIKPVALGCTSTKGMQVIAIGNGVSSILGTSSILQYVELQITRQKKYEIFSNGIQLKHIAPGDSGGPLVAADTGALIGVTSNGGLGKQCFTRIAAYLSWIKHTSGISICVNKENDLYTF